MAIGIKPCENIFPWVNYPQAKFTMNADLVWIPQIHRRWIYRDNSFQSSQLLLSNSPLTLEQAISEFASPPFNQKSTLEKEEF